jgi:excisionase family DNA binding protein
MGCEPLINARAAAALLDASEKTVKRMAARGELPAFRVGNRWKFRASELDEWMRSRLLSSRQSCPERSVVE